MQKPRSNSPSFVFVVILMIAMAAIIFGSAPYVQAQDIATPTPEAQEITTPAPSEYYTVKPVAGTNIEQDIINGPPVPPPGFEVERQAVSLPEPDITAGTNTLTVPAFTWVLGAASVSGAMIAGYYDRSGWPNMYTGPTGGGVTPLDNSSWGTWSDGVATYPNIPLAASHNGVDGRTIKGSIDDYWVRNGSGALDPYITGSWTQHSWGTAIGDYMKTSQSAYGNTDGSTTFWNYTTSASPLTCAYMLSGGISTTDGTYGRKLFYEAKGYTVTDCYTQKTDNTVAGGFSYAQFRAQIDAGHPVMLNLAGHTIVGVGYMDPSTVYVHDTWDYLTHSMIWGGSYSGMQLLNVSVVNIQGNKVELLLPLNGATLHYNRPTFDWTDFSGATGYQIQVSKNNTFTLLVVNANTSAANSTYTPTSNLPANVPLYWRVRAKLGTHYSAWSLVWTLHTGGTPPSIPSLLAPADNALTMDLTPLLDWTQSSDATFDHYQIQVADNPDFTGAVDVDIAGIANDAYNPASLDTNTKYYWHVRSWNTAGDYSAWSALRTFREAMLPPGLVSPIGGITVGSRKPVFDWGDVTGATKYNLQVSLNSAFSSLVLNLNVTDSTYTPLVNLAANKLFYWRVKALGPNGPSAWSAVETFHTP